jgi:hypothetical protein
MDARSSLGVEFVAWRPMAIPLQTCMPQTSQVAAADQVPVTGSNHVLAPSQKPPAGNFSKI